MRHELTTRGRGRRTGIALAALPLLFALAAAPAPTSHPETLRSSETGHEAIAMLEHQMRLFPGNTTIRRRLAEAYAERNRFDEGLHLAERLDAADPANARLLIRLHLARSETKGDAARRLALCEEAARRAGILVAAVATSTGLEREYATLLEESGRSTEALRVLMERQKRTPERASAERILSILVATGQSTAPVFAIENGLPLPFDPRQPRRWLDHPDQRVGDAVLDHLADSRTFVEEERWLDRRMARGETEAALTGLAALAERTKSSRLAMRGLELTRGRDAALEARFIAILPDDAIAGLPLSLLERGLELARARSDDAGALLWARLIAARQTADVAAQIAWFRLAEKAGRDETAAIAAVWRIKRDEPWILKERLRRRGATAQETLLGEYLGPLDPEIALWRLEMALARKEVHQFLPLAGVIGKEELGRRHDLLDSMAHGLVQARLLDEVIRLDALVSLRDSRRAAVAAALVAAGRFEDAIRFGATEPGVLVRAALARQDTPAAISAAVAAFGGGRLDALTVDLIARAAPDPGLRRLAALHARVRGMKRIGKEEEGFVTPAARLLFVSDPLERAELHWARGAPHRTVAILKRIPAAAPGLLVRAADRVGETATVAARIADAIEREPRAVDLRILALRLAASRDDSDAMIHHLETIERIAGDAAAGGQAVPPAPGMALFGGTEDATVKPHLDRLAPLYAEKGRRALPDRAAALAWFERAFARAPNDAVTCYNIALLHAQAGRIDSALLAAERATELAPERSDGLILLASLLKKKERHADAVTAYRRAIDAGAPLEARHELALLLKALGEIQSAYIAAAEAHRLKPGDPTLARTFGVIAAQIGRWQEALDPLRLAVRTVPSDAEARSYLAHSYLECGRLAEARQAIAPHPDAWTRIEIQARAEMAENRPVRAVELLRPIAIRSGGASLLTRAIALAADAALSRGDVAGAQRYWNEWLRIEPKAEVPRALLAATRAPAPQTPIVVTAPVESAPVPRAAGETRPATARGATPTSPTPVAAPRQETTAPQPRLTLRDAAASLRDGDNIRAEAAARQVLATRQDSVEALNLLGIALERQGRRAAAIEAFERSLAVNANQAAVREAIQELKIKNER